MAIAMTQAKRNYRQQANPHDVAHPLQFYIHIPKTAGSTINALLETYDENGLDHCESIIRNPKAFKNAANTLTWLSGHVDLTTALQSLRKATSRPVQFYTCMRDPVSQVASHYNWLIEIFHKGDDFYNNHPDHIKNISEDIRNSDNSSVTDIMENIKKYPSLFLNFQAKFILGNGFNWNKGSIFRRLDEYTTIMEHSDAPALAAEILNREHIESVRKNESRYHFDKSLFHRPVMQKFLRNNNGLDYILHEIISFKTAKKAPAAKRETAQSN